MTYLGAIIADLITKWSLYTYILLRIRILVGLLILMYSLMLSLSGILVFSTRRPKVKVLDSVSEALLVYTFGAMQAAPFKNKMFPIWALFLVNFCSGVYFLSKFDLSFETVYMVKLWAVVLLRLKHGSDVGRFPFWILRCVLVLGSLYRFIAHFGASKHSWYGSSSGLLHRYMSRNRDDDFDPRTMVGCKYLVHGQYGEQLSGDDDLITLEKIWQLDDPPISRNNQQLAMAFALSRLLRCRLEGAKLHSNTMTKKLFCCMLEAALKSETEEPAAAPQSEAEPAATIVRIPEEYNANRGKELFRILVMELMFLNHHLHTGYPVVFCLGLRSYYFHVGLGVLRGVAISWLLLGPSVVDSMKSVATADKFITDIIVWIMAIFDFLVMVRYLTSYWTRLLAVCKFVRCRSRCLRFILGPIVSDGNLLFSERIKVKFVIQYDLLHSPTYKSGELKPFTGKVGLPELFFLNPLKSTELLIAAVIPALGVDLLNQNDPPPRVCVSVNQEQQIQFVTDSEGCLRLPKGSK